MTTDFYKLTLAHRIDTHSEDDVSALIECPNDTLTGTIIISSEGKSKREVGMELIGLCGKMIETIQKEYILS